MKHRISYEEIEGEMVKQEVEVFPYCTCLSASGYDLVKVPYKPDEDDGQEVCALCGSYVVWTNQEEISNNARR